MTTVTGAVLVLLLASRWAWCQSRSEPSNLMPCDSGGVATLKYLQGDAMTGSTRCLGPGGEPYPSDVVRQVVASPRKSRSSKLIDPLDTQQTLLRHYEAANFGDLDDHQRRERSLLTENPTYFDTQSRRRPSSDVNRNCPGPSNRLCKTRYNTTAPLYGVSLTSGSPVTIVQKFPDLLQQVIYEVCDSSECDVVHGECVQTYVPYLFLVIPLGPVTLTGQDYVLVESGCACRPKYASRADPDPLSVIPNF